MAMAWLDAAHRGQPGLAGDADDSDNALPPPVSMSMLTDSNHVAVMMACGRSQGPCSSQHRSTPGSGSCWTRCRSCRPLSVTTATRVVASCENFYPPDNSHLTSVRLTCSGGGCMAGAGLPCCNHSRPYSRGVIAQSAAGPHCSFRASGQAPRVGCVVIGDTPDRHGATTSPASRLNGECAQREPCQPRFCRSAFPL